MAWTYLPEAVLDRSHSSTRFQNTEQYAMSNGINTANRSSMQESEMGSFATLQSGTTCKPSTANLGVGKWISSLADSHANLFLLLARTKGQMTREICGPILGESLAKYDPDTRSWRTSQISLFTNTLDEFSETWPKSGTIVSGMLYLRPSLVPPTLENASGYWLTPSEGDHKSVQGKAEMRALAEMERTGKRPPTTYQRLRNQVLWPTPKGSPSGPDYARTGRPNSGGDDLATAVARTWATPQANDATKRGKVSPRKGAMGLSEQTGGQLNPTFVEWLMGWPSGWTDLKCLEMDGCLRLWLESFRSVERNK